MSQLSLTRSCARDVRAISLFSGVGGFEIGFERAGIQTVLQAEQDQWCLRVLERHWPETERVSDVRGVGDRREPARRDAANGVRAVAEGGWRQTGAGLSGGVDLVYGGFPCQDVSVAGKRAGLSGERSGLWSEFRRVLSELRPRWFVAENVPGLLSICSCACCQLIVEWAAEHAQRIADGGGKGVCGCAECREGHKLRSRHSGRDFAHILAEVVDLGYGVAWRVVDARWFGVPQRRRRVFIVGCLGDAARAAQVLAVCESCGGHPAPRQQEGQGVAYSLAASARGTGDGHGNAWNSTYITEDGGTLPVPDVRTTATLTSGGHRKGVNLPGRHKEDDENLVVGSPGGETMRALTARESGYRMDFEAENFVVADLRNGTVDDEAMSLQSGAGHHGHGSPRGDGSDNLIASSLRANAGDGRGWSGDRGDGSDNLVAEQGVRRLTPLEAERLMGWPDGWTELTADGEEVADSHRYRMCGNGVVAPVAEWLGHRLVAVDKQLFQTEESQS
jgi:DNA (cytosine-5)-methyltransferase 1